MKTADTTEHATHRAAVAAARALKAETDQAFNAVLATRDDLDHARNRLATVEANYRENGLHILDTQNLIDDMKRRILNLEADVAAAEARCRVVAADRLAEHDRVITEAAAEIEEARKREDQEAAAVLEANRRKTANEAVERLSLRQRRMDDRRKLLASVAEGHAA